MLARRLARDWEADPDIPEDALERAREAIYTILALYFEREGVAGLGEEFVQAAENVFAEPGALLDLLAERRLLPDVDTAAEEMFAAALEPMPKNLKRRMLLTYLGFPFYDIVTLPLLRGEDLSEYDPVKVDRISPDDAGSIRAGGAAACLRGVEFYNFGAFFSRAYRENDYLWGRLHGAERMIDLVCSTLDQPPTPKQCAQFKRAAFLAILDEEAERLTTDPELIAGIRREIGEG